VLNVIAGHAAVNKGEFGNLLHPLNPLWRATHQADRSGSEPGLDEEHAMFITAQSNEPGSTANAPNGEALHNPKVTQSLLAVAATRLERASCKGHHHGR
jgi:hypothetical protein